MGGFVCVHIVSMIQWFIFGGVSAVYPPQLPVSYCKLQQKDDNAMEI